MPANSFAKLLMVLFFGTTVAVAQKYYLSKKVSDQVLSAASYEEMAALPEQKSKNKKERALIVKADEFDQAEQNSVFEYPEEKRDSDIEKSGQRNGQGTVAFKSQQSSQKSENSPFKNHNELKRSQLDEGIAQTTEPAQPARSVASAGSSVAATTNHANSITSGSDKKSSGETTTGGGGSNSAVVTGIVHPLKTMTLVRSNYQRILPEIKNFLISDAYAANCSAVASLYELDPVTSLPAAAPKNSVVVKSDATFYFNPSTLNLDINKPNKYLVRVTGCNGDYQRIITDYFSNQDISIGTTLLSKVLEVPTSNKVVEIQPEQLQKLTSYIDPNSTTFESAYTNLTSIPTASGLFSTTFGNDISTLTNTKPQVVSENISVMVNEKSNTSYSITSEHWYSSYDIVQEWYLDTNFMITGASYIYSPGANDQGVHVLKTRIGKNNGSNRVDTTLPYEEKTWNITVVDTSPVTAPAFSLSASNPTPVLSNILSLDINTGAALINCETLSNFAITETAIVPPASEFSYSCSTANSQTETITLTDLADGAKSLYLWAIDSSGTISSTPRTISYRKDTSLPTSTLTNILGTIQGGSPYTLNFSAADNNEIASIVVKFSSDNGVTFSNVATLAAGSTTYSWNVPAVETLSNFIKITATDGAGKTVDSVTSKFVISTTTPSAPAYALVTPATTNNSNVSLTVTSCTNTTHILLNSGTAPADNDAGWVPCSTAAGNYSYTLSAVEGMQNFAISAKDATNDISAASTVAILLDTTAPAASIANLPAEVKGTDSYGLTFSSSDLNGIQSRILQYTLDGTNYTAIAANPASPYTWTLPAANTTTARLKYIVTDVAGNVTTVTNSSFTIDSTPPGTQSISLYSGTPSPLTAVTLTSASCADTPYVLVNEGTAPAAGSASWQACSTVAGAITYSIAAVEGTHNLKIWFKDSVGHVSTTSSSATMIYDITSPSASIGAVTASLKGGATQSVTFTSSDANGVQSTKLQYAADGTTFSDVAANPVSPYSWTIPSSNTSGSKLRMVVTDNAGNISTVDSNAFSIDSTPPAAPALALVSPALTNSLVNTFTASSCTDTPTLLFNEGVQPAPGDAGWTACTTTASALTYSIAGTEGAHTIKVWSKDSVGNISATSTDFTITYDVTNPTQTLNNLAALLKGGATTSITFTQSDTNGINTHKLQYASDGVTFSDIVSTPASPYTWTIPSHNTSAAKIKLITTDNAGNTASVTSTAFTIDSTPPAAPALALVSPALTNSLVNTFTASSCTDTPSLLFNEGVQPAAGDGGWTACTTTASALTYSIAGTEGAHTIKVWSKDAAGNVSLTATSFTITYDITAPAQTLNNLAALLKGGDTAGITFTQSDTNGINTHKLQYASDGVTFSDIVSNPVSPYTWTIPSHNTSAAKIKLITTDNAGNTASVTSTAFTIDSTPPAAPALALVSPALTNSLVTTFTASSCSDTPTLLFNEGAQPASGAAGWTTCTTTASALTYSIAGTEGAHTIKVWSKDAAGNVSLTATSFTITYDITAPALTLNNLAALLKGGDTAGITFTQSDTNGISTHKLQYASDGVTFSDIVSTPVSPYTWTIPSHNTNAAKIKLITTDNAGNTASVTSAAFTIDSTAPFAPSLARVTPALTNSLVNTFTASSCTDTPSLLFNEGAQPLPGAAGWTACSTAPSALSYSIAGGEGAHTIKVWSKDAAGNVSAASSDFAITYDITIPAQVLNNLAALIKGGTNTNITFTQSDANGINSHKLQYASDGVTFSDIVSNPASPYSWAVPSHNTSAAKIKLVTTDNAGNTASATSAAFTIDSTPPAAPVANLYTPAISSSTTVAVTITDCLDRPNVIITESMIAPGAGDAGWISCNTTAGGLSTVLVGPVLQGVHTLYVWAKDSAGNISASTSVSMSYDNVAPTVNLATTMSGSYKGGTSLALSFSATDASGVNAIKVEYATDGTTFGVVATLAAGTTSYNWTIPSDNTSTAKLRITANDVATATNTNSSTSAAFTIDSTAPAAPSVALASSAYSSSTSVTLTAANCTDRTHLFVNEGAMPASGDAGWQTCLTAAGAITYTIGATQGTHSLKVWAKDTVGNVSSATTVTMVYDSIAPSITINAGSNVKGNQNSTVTFSVTEINATAAQNFLVEYYDGALWSSWNVAAQNGPLSGTTFSTTITAPNSENTTLILKVSFTDLAGNTTQSSVQFKTDLTAPIVDLLSVNGGSLSTTNNNIQIALNAHDSVSKVTQFCLKYHNSTPPDASSSCWKDVNAPSPGIAPNTVISFTGYFYQIGFAKGNYLIYAWVKDEAGQISSNASAINTDTFNIAFDPGTPPLISKVQVTNSDAPANPVTSSDLTSPGGGDIYIKWNASDLEGLAASPISIKYTTNDSTFLDLSGGNNLINGVNGGCTIDAGYTGCAVLSAPTGSYFKIRVIAADTLGTTVFFNSAPLNENRFRIIAGNTEHGLNGSARSAVFYVNGNAAGAHYAYKNKLVVSDDGKFFYLDPVRGLLWIDPATGILKSFMTTSGSSTGDGGNVSSGTLASPQAIALDHANHLLIWDSVKIRRVNLETMIINTVVGGGAQTDPLVTVNSTDMNLGGFNSSSGTLIPLPNGDIIFTAPAGTLHHRRYRAIDQKIELIETTGVGITSNPTDIWTDKSKLDLGVTYNTTTSALTFMAQGIYKSWVGDSYPLHSRIDISSGNETTPYSGIGPYDLPLNTSYMYSGLDGKLYSVPRFRGSLNRYDPATNTLTRVLGTGSYGTSLCPEDTLATSCAVDIDSFFISRNGRITFIDNGVLRTVDDNNRVITLFGQYSSYGDNVASTAARFGAISDINLGKASDGNKVIVEDTFSSYFREFTIGGNLTNVAPVYYSWHGPYGFEVDQATGDILMPNGATLKKFDRLTNTYSNVVGGGSNTYYDSASDGKMGTEINLVSGYSLTTLGLINNKLYYNKYYWTGSGYAGCAVKSYTTTDSYRQAHVMGDASNTCSTNITVGNNLSSSSIWAGNDLMKFQSFSDPADSVTKLFFARAGTNQIFKSLNGGPIENFVSLAHNTTAYTYNFNASGLNIYYCATNGYLYKYNYNAGTTTQLGWNSPTIKCTGAKSILYHPARNSLILSFSQNGLYGIGEYDLN